MPVTHRLSVAWRGVVVATIGALAAFLVGSSAAASHVPGDHFQGKPRIIGATSPAQAVSLLARAGARVDPPDTDPAGSAPDLVAVAVGAGPDRSVLADAGPAVGAPVHLPRTSCRGAAGCRGPPAA